MGEKWPVKPYIQNKTDDNISVIRQEVENFRLFQEDQLSDTSETNNNTTLQEGVSISKVYWSGEETYCYQLEIGEHKICRRQDTNFINASKLIKLSSMTRGRRDGILRCEKLRYTVRKDRLEFSGIWIPFERAKHLAMSADIYDQVHVLFSYDMELVYQQQVSRGN